MKAYRRMLAQAGVAAGADTVFLWCPLPAGSTLKSVDIDLQIVGVTTPTMKQACQYSLNAFIFPIEEPAEDIIADPNTLWDAMVPKDLDYGGDMEMDSDTPVTAPTDTPMMINPNRMFGGYSPRRVFNRHRTLMVTNPLSIPSTSTTWQPLDRIKTKMHPNHTARNPMVFMMGIGSPDLGVYSDISEVFPVVKSQWIPTTLLHWMILADPKEALMHWKWAAAGLAEEVNTAWQNVIQSWIEQAYIEDDGTIIDQAYDVLGEATFEVETAAALPRTLTSKE